MDEEKRVVFHIRNILESQGYVDLLAIHRAHVPIVKLREADTDTEIDICVNSTLGIHNSQLLRTYALLDPVVRPLTLVVKVSLGRAVVVAAAAAAAAADSDWWSRRGPSAG